VPHQEFNSQTNRWETTLSPSEDKRAAAILKVIIDREALGVRCELHHLAQGLISTGLATTTPQATRQVSGALHCLRIVFGMGVYDYNQETGDYGLAQTTIAQVTMFIRLIRLVLRRDYHIIVQMEKSVLPVGFKDTIRLLKNANNLHRDAMDSLVDKLPAKSQVRKTMADMVKTEVEQLNI
jgi:hypothetical protein